MKIAFIVLAHQYPHLIERLLRRILLDEDCFVVVHYDLKAANSDINEIKNALDKELPRIAWTKRIDICWGEWSMVAAILNGIQTIFEKNWSVDYVYLISGADYPIKPLDSLKTYLTINKGKEFIESFDADEYNWIARGIQKERYEYWHLINWKSHPKVFDLSLKLQKLIGLKRKLPEGLRPFIGSQWWTLTRDTCEQILRLSQNKKIIKFFKRVWVPDEMFFQSLVRSVVTEDKIPSHSLTLYEFSDYGVPIVYYDGHQEHLKKQNFFFARKLSPFAIELRDFLDSLTIDNQKLTKINYDAIGEKIKVYRQYRLVGRKGLFGKRKVGKIEDVWYGDLEWNKFPYFVVYGYSDRLLQLAASLLNAFEGITCHGRLFNNDEIEFFDNRSHYAGYSKYDIKLRDHNNRTFLSQIIQEDSNVMTGFLLNQQESDDLIDLCIWDLNATVFLLQEEPILSYAERSSIDNITDYEKSDFTNYCQIFLNDQQRIIDLFKQSRCHFFHLSLKDFLNRLKQDQFIRELTNFLGKKPRFNQIKKLASSTTDLFDSLLLESTWVELLEVQKTLFSNYNKDTFNYSLGSAVNRT